MFIPVKTHACIQFRCSKTKYVWYMHKLYSGSPFTNTVKPISVNAFNYIHYFVKLLNVIIHPYAQFHVGVNNNIP